MIPKLRRSAKLILGTYTPLYGSVIDSLIQQNLKDLPGCARQCGVNAGDTVVGKIGLVPAMIELILRVFQSSLQVPFPFLCVSLI